MNIENDEIKKKADYCLGCKVKMCKKGCPLENDITEFVKCIKEERYKDAYEVLADTTVLQPICGRICPHISQCEGSCVRGIKGEAVSIGELESYIGDLGIKNNYEIPKFTNEIKDKKIAIIGGGPAGLSCATYLARNGYMVTIFEKYDKLGGILAHGIPDFRLDKEILQKQINKILDLGIEVKYNASLGKDYKIEELEKEYDAIFLAFGANVSVKMGIVGEDLPRSLWWK